MLSPELAAEFGITPLSDDYLITLEQAEQDGGIKDEFADRVIPIYRKATMSETLRDHLEALVAYWDGKRYPAYHCANDLRLLLATGRLPSDLPSEIARRG